ncbi:MAG: hypothetical protein A3G75_16640, partial [Verrucomicrobia bacterium RIFCSPLOWO2_12_FULL_64_8]
MVFALLSFLSGRGEAHNISVSYAEIAATDHQVRWQLRVPVPELDLLLELDQDHDGKVAGAELQQQGERVREYLRSQVAVEREGVALPASVGNLRLWLDNEGHPFLETEIVFPSAEKLGRATFRCEVLQDASASHRTLAKITSAGAAEEFVFEGRKAYSAEQRSRLAAVYQFLQMGVFHILTGYDHIVFLLGLVLIGGSFRNIVKIVTSFTVAHSLTLALAALDVVVLPSRLVESGIALSIMYIAAENLFFKSFDRRWIVTFFFGLVHCFGFAGALRELALSREALGTALFCFNFGVELGQICIVALLLPMVWSLQDKKFSPALVRV